MTKNILIFRTDRIGDLLITCPTIKTIKNYISDAKISIITSEKNYEYAKTFDIFDEVYKFPKSNIFNKIKFYTKFIKKKFDYVFIFDGKDRSIILASLLKSKTKVAKTTNKKQIYYCSIFGIKNEIDIFGKDLNILHKKMLEKSDLDVSIDNFNYLKFKKNNNFAQIVPFDEYIHVHFDEKWFSSSYIKTYNDINPSYEQFTNFINLLSKKNNILITTGLLSNNLIERLLLDSKEKLNPKVYKYNLSENVFIIYKPTFLDLESLLRKSKVLISCHGALTHAAASFNIKIIDIVEESSDQLIKRYSLYMNNYYKVYRENFKNLILNINQKI